MATKNKNPYRADSQYGKIFTAIRKSNGVTTRQALVEQGFNPHAVTVVLSPRAEGVSNRTKDCRGNSSAQGHVYYMEELNKKKGEPKKFRLRWRKVALDPRPRPDAERKMAERAAKKAEKSAKVKVDSEKTVSAKAKAEVEKATEEVTA